MLSGLTGQAGCAKKSVFSFAGRPQRNAKHIPAGSPDQEKLISLRVLSVSNDPEPSSRAQAEGQRRRSVGGEDMKCKQFNAPRSNRDTNGEGM